MSNKYRNANSSAATGIRISEMEQEFPESQFFGLVFLISDPMSIQLKIVQGSNIRSVVRHAVNVWKQKGKNSRDGFLLQDSVPSFMFLRKANLLITPEVEWPQTIREFTSVLKPGGILDLVEVDPIPSFDPPFLIHTLAAQAAIGFGGVDWRVASKIAQYVEASNDYTDIQVIRRTIPIGWDGELGQLCRIHMESAQIAIMPVLAAAMKNGTPSNASPDFSQFSVSGNRTEEAPPIIFDGQGRVPKDSTSI
ncbi:hypothetical protein BJ742DRAFT_867581 [Cladochytrium replicatum]|nr:hypothetical protein BJ742DRAFT_867581 [Cladochytrium replicatum]